MTSPWWDMVIHGGIDGASRRIMFLHCSDIRDLKQRGRERERRRLRKITFLFRSLLLCAGHLGLFLCLKTLRIAKRLNVSL